MATNNPQGGERTPDVQEPLDPNPNTPFTEISSKSGHVGSYAVTASELRLVLKNDKELVYTLENTALHYPSVLSMIITAAVQDEEISVGTNALVDFVSGEKKILTFGLGTDPVVE